MKISIIGLGKLGSPMAAVMAHKGHTVVGVDLNPAYVAALNEGRPPVEEPGLTEMISANRGRLSATEHYERAILGTDLTFIIVPTPSGGDGKFSMQFVLASAEKIGAALRKKAGWHLVVLSSTVMPGSTGSILAPALEKFSGKKCGPDFGLCYNPEFIALGSVINDMLRPDMILIGESDERSGKILEDLYNGVCESNPRINRMNYVNAELTKLSVNTFVTTKISYANMLAEVCETLPGADVDVVTQAIGCDTRIGRKYLRGAMGYGGPCFPRDNVAFSALARTNNVPALLAEATDQVNRRQAPRLAAMLRAHVLPNGVAGVLGLSYKPSTGVIEESQGIRVAQELLSAGVPVVVYDPAAMDNAKEQLTGNVTFAHSAAECVRQADAFAITTSWPEFSSISPRDLKRADGSVLVLDCWRMLDRSAFESVSDYRVVGEGRESAISAPEELAVVAGDA
jgi:UDPglucose 6-dehydrogenase